jgi:hypothetical protein
MCFVWGTKWVFSPRRQHSSWSQRWKPHILHRSKIISVFFRPGHSQQNPQWILSECIDRGMNCRKWFDCSRALITVPHLPSCNAAITTAPIFLPRNSEAKSKSTQPETKFILTHVQQDRHLSPPSFCFLCKHFQEVGQTTATLRRKDAAWQKLTKFGIVSFLWKVVWREK